MMVYIKSQLCVLQGVKDDGLHKVTAVCVLQGVKDDGVHKVTTVCVLQGVKDDDGSAAPAADRSHLGGQQQKDGR